MTKRLHDEKHFHDDLIFNTTLRISMKCMTGRRTETGRALVEDNDARGMKETLWTIQQKAY